MTGTTKTCWNVVKRMSEWFYVARHTLWSDSLGGEAGGPSWVPVWDVQLVFDLKWSCCSGISATASQLQLMSFLKFSSFHIPGLPSPPVFSQQFRQRHN